MLMNVLGIYATLLLFVWTPKDPTIAHVQKASLGMATTHALVRQCIPKSVMKNKRANFPFNVKMYHISVLIGSLYVPFVWQLQMNLIEAVSQGWSGCMACFISIWFKTRAIEINISCVTGYLYTVSHTKRIFSQPVNILTKRLVSAESYFFPPKLSKDTLVKTLWPHMSEYQYTSKFFGTKTQVADFCFWCW